VGAFTIAARELRSLFVSPLAWTVLAVVQAILAYVFLTQLELFMQWKPHLPRLSNAPGITAFVVAPLLKSAGIVLLLASPLLTMRLIAEERRTGTINLLLSAPLAMTEIVLGKFLGILAFLVVVVAMVTLMPLSLLVGGTLDLGLLAAGLLGLLLLVTSFAAAGLFVSTLTREPAAAAIATFGLLFLLWIIDWAGDATEAGAGALFAYLSLTSHLDTLLRGVVDSADVSYYLIFTVTFLALAIRRLDAMRLGD